MTQITNYSTQKPASYQRVFYNNTTGDVINHDTVLTVEDRVTVFRESNRTPNFRKLKRSNLPPLPFYFSKKTERGLSGTFVTKDSFGTSVKENGVFPIIGVYDGADFPELDSYLKIHSNKFLTDIKDQKVNLAVAFAEKTQTATLFLQTASRIVQGLSALKSGDLAGAARALLASVDQKRVKAFNRAFRRNPTKAISRAWLELQYGWKPLLSDVYGAAEAVAQATLEEGKRSIRTRSRFKVTYNLPDIQTDFGRRVLSRKVVHILKIQDKVEVELENPALHYLSALGITNPATVIWELVPFSFVIDWIIPIGNYINTWDATVGLVFRRYTRTITHDITTSVTETGSGVVYSGTVCSGSATAAHNVFVCHRLIPAVPSPYLPQFKNPFSPTHLMNGLSLIFSFKK